MQKIKNKMKTKDIIWYNNKIQDIKKRKRNLEMIIDPNLKKKIRKDLKVEQRAAKRAMKQDITKFIKEEVEKYDSD